MFYTTFGRDPKSTGLEMYGVRYDMSGGSAFLGLKVINDGLIDTEGYSVKVSEVRGSEESVFYEYTDEEGIIPAGGSVLLNIPRTVSSNADGLKIKAVVTELNVDASEPLVVEESVPYETRLIADTYEIARRNGRFYADIVIKNNGNKPSEAQEITVSPAYGEKTYATETLNALGAGESQELSLEITPEFADFNHAGIVSVKLQSGDIEEYANLISVTPATVEINGGAEGISLNGNDDSAVIEAKAAPWNAIAGDAQYTSSDSAVACVSEDGKVTPAGNGTAVITAYYPMFGISDDISVTVTGVTAEDTDTEPEATPAPTRKPYSGGSGGGGVTIGRSTPAQTAAPDTTAKPSDSGWWFKDVPQSEWYYAPIKAAYEDGLMSGMTDDTFEPETDITRGMFAFVIYNMENAPDAEGGSKFDDVKESSYYETAIAWAAENGIVAGYDDTQYGPDDPITREQMAALFYRYARYKGSDVSVDGDTSILSFADAPDISEYAVSAMQWVCGEGIISGFEDNTLRPRANTTRAQTAAILERFTEKDKTTSEA